MRVIAVEMIETPPGWSLSLGTGRDERTGQRLWFYCGLDEMADVRLALESYGGPITVLVPAFYVLPDSPMVV